MRPWQLLKIPVQVPVQVPEQLVLSGASRPPLLLPSCRLPGEPSHSHPWIPEGERPPMGSPGSVAVPSPLP